MADNKKTNASPIDWAARNAEKKANKAIIKTVSTPVALTHSTEMEMKTNSHLPGAFGIIILDQSGDKYQLTVHKPISAAKADDEDWIISHPGIVAGYLTKATNPHMEGVTKLRAAFYLNDAVSKDIFKRSEDGKIMYRIEGDLFPPVEKLAYSDMDINELAGAVRTNGPANHTRDELLNFFKKATHKNLTTQHKVLFDVKVQAMREGTKKPTFKAPAPPSNEKVREYWPDFMKISERRFASLKEEMREAVNTQFPVPEYDNRGPAPPVMQQPVAYLRGLTSAQAQDTISWIMLGRVPPGTVIIDGYLARSEGDGPVKQPSPPKVPPGKQPE
jgi:hypothetical protein